MDQFLASVERRAFRIARFATGNTEEALDLVQDAMIKLVQKYSDKTENDWPGLFYTILNSRIHDWYRRTKVRNRWRVWLTSGDDDSAAQEPDLISAQEDPNAERPDEQIEASDAAQAIEQALAELPPRQQQAFMLRKWEGLSVDETAQAMQCSAGSVKTHLSRAIARLKELLAEFEIP